MYTASSAFHTAVENGAPQKALLIFSNAVFTNEDINIEQGIEFNDYFNTEDGLTIGQAISNEISFSIFNDAGTLNNYEFGDFLATIGAQTDTESYIIGSGETVRCEAANEIYIGKETSPYLLRGDAAVSSQPSFPVQSIIAYEGKIYVFGSNKQYAVYDDSDGSNITASNPVNSFMRNKSKNRIGIGSYYNKTTRMLETWHDGVHETYEFVPIGYFTAKRPNVPSVNEVHFTCYDYIQKFEVDMPIDEDLKTAYEAKYPSDTAGYTYPISFEKLFKAMCAYVNVSFYSSTFINSTATISARPDEFDSATMRDVLGWIAESAGSNLRFNRDGQLVFDWIRPSSLVLDEGDYVECSPYWYETKKINKLYNRDSFSGTDRTVGSGDNGYLIQDNPLLKGVS